VPAVIGTGTVVGAAVVAAAEVVLALPPVVVAAAAVVADAFVSELLFESEPHAANPIVSAANPAASVLIRMSSPWW